MPEHGIWCELAVEKLRYGRDYSKTDLIPLKQQLALKSKLEQICASISLPFEELDSDGRAFSVSLDADGDMPPKHVLQEHSIVGHMRRAGVLQSSRTLLNLGCGRAGLSDQLQALTSVSHHHVLVDRNPMKRARCCDNRVRERGGRVDRVVADLCELDLRELSLNSPVACSKHLCGVATDYALRCLDVLDASTPSRRTPCFIAPCCHHLATWEDYTNQDWLASFGFDETDFNHMCILSSWASLEVDHESNSVEERGLDAVEALSRSDKHSFGKQCKLFLDIGRVEALKAKYRHATLVQYTTLSVESRLIVAHD